MTLVTKIATHPVFGCVTDDRSDKFVAQGHARGTRGRKRKICITTMTIQQPQILRHSAVKNSCMLGKTLKYIIYCKKNYSEIPTKIFPLERNAV